MSAQVEICNQCGDECDLFDVDPPLYDETGEMMPPSSRHCVSFCCRSSYKTEMLEEGETA